MSDLMRTCPTCGERAADDARFCAKDGSPLVSTGLDPMIGRVLAGRLRLDERLGRGGMGTVYRAHQLSVGRDVAVKLIDARLAADPDGARRFLREARLASRLRHPGTALIIDFGQENDGVLWLAMTLIPGQTLAELLSAEGVLAPRRALQLVRQLTAVLVEAHGLGVLHRDLKPANVMVAPDAAGEERVTLLDFGIARSLTEQDATTITASGTVCGTVAYMAPEVACGDPAEPRSDLYSLGVILYELLAGRRPFEHERAEVLMRMHVTEDPPALSHVPALVQNLVLRCLAKEPNGRFQDAAHLLAALDATLDGLDRPTPEPNRPAATVTVTGERPVVKEVRLTTDAVPVAPKRRPWWLIGLAAVGLGVAIASWPRPDATTPPEATVPPAAAPSVARPPPSLVPRREPEAEAMVAARGEEGTAAGPVRPAAVPQSPAPVSLDSAPPEKPTTRPTKPRPERVDERPAFIVPGG